MFHWCNSRMTPSYCVDQPCGINARMTPCRGVKSWSLPDKYRFGLDKKNKPIRKRLSSSTHFIECCSFRQTNYQFMICLITWVSIWAWGPIDSPQGKETRDESRDTLDISHNCGCPYGIFRCIPLGIQNQRMNQKMALWEHLRDLGANHAPPWTEHETEYKQVKTLGNHKEFFLNFRSGVHQFILWLPSCTLIITLTGMNSSDDCAEREEITNDPSGILKQQDNPPLLERKLHQTYSMGNYRKVPFTLASGRSIHVKPNCSYTGLICALQCTHLMARIMDDIVVHLSDNYAIAAHLFIDGFCCLYNCLQIYHFIFCWLGSLKE